MLSNVRHRAMITPGSPPLTRLIHIRPNYWTIFHSFGIILKMGTVRWIGLQMQISIPAWSKHWHAGRMRPANAFCIPYISQSHKDIVLARQPF